MPTKLKPRNLNRERKDKQKRKKEQGRNGLSIPTGPPLTPQVSGAKRARHVQFSADVLTGQFLNVALFRIALFRITLAQSGYVFVVFSFFE